LQADHCLNSSQQSAGQANILNISTYKFVDLSLDRLTFFKEQIHQTCLNLNLKGTAILALEGLNLFLAGTIEAINAFFNWIKQTPEFFDLAPKESMSEMVPFRKLIVKIKSEIITMRQPIKPQSKRAPAVEAKTLKRWLDNGVDDAGREVVMLDTRNAFEVGIGTFNNAVDFNITKFTEFVPAIEANKKDLEDKTVVSFCTGGIRCEKAAILMENIGLDHVYQLEGGILKYFEEVGGAHYHGDCFVFDYRTALKPDLQPSDKLQCYGCRAVLTVEDQASDLYQPPSHCPHCYDEKKALLSKKQARIEAKNKAKLNARREYCQSQKAKFTQAV
jgi:UPF0176 protein